MHHTINKGLLRVFRVSSVMVVNTITEVILWIWIYWFRLDDMRNWGMDDWGVDDGRCMGNDRSV